MILLPACKEWVELNYKTKERTFLSIKIDFAALERRGNQVVG